MSALGYGDSWGEGDSPRLGERPEDRYRTYPRMTPKQCVALYRGLPGKPWSPGWTYRGKCGHCGGEPGEHHDG